MVQIAEGIVQKLNHASYNMEVCFLHQGCELVEPDRRSSVRTPRSLASSGARTPLLQVLGTGSSTRRQSSMSRHGNSFSHSREDLSSAKVSSRLSLGPKSSGAAASGRRCGCCGIMPGRRQVRLCHRSSSKHARHTDNLISRQRARHRSKLICVR